MAYRLGVDVGGTFTDLLLINEDTGETHRAKTPSTPDDPSRGVLTGIEKVCDAAGIGPGELIHLLHGTTVATNAVLEGKGARTGMITTRGYRDIIHVARHQRPQHYSIMQEIPWQDRPLVRRRHRKVVSERLAPPKGEVVEPLAEDEVREAARALKAEGVEAIAVCFLFSYIDPKHEERARALVEEEFPEAFVCTSAAVSPQFREFERFTTAAMNELVRVTWYEATTRGSVMVAQNRSHPIDVVRIGSMAKGMRTMRLRYASVNPIVIPNPGRTDRRTQVAHTCRRACRGSAALPPSDQPGDSTAFDVAP